MTIRCVKTEIPDYALPEGMRGIFVGGGGAVRFRVSSAFREWQT
jgi:hypothetical protein